MKKILFTLALLAVVSCGWGQELTAGKFSASSAGDDYVWASTAGNVLVSSGSFDTINFATETNDSGGCYTNGTYTAPLTGWYLIVADVTTVASAANVMTLHNVSLRAMRNDGFVLGGIAIPLSPGSNVGVSLVSFVPLSKGQSFSIQGYGYSADGAAIAGSDLFVKRIY